MKRKNATKKPNIIFITSDQHRGDTMGCMGHPCIRTPHLDMLAKQGILFTNAYTDSPVCIPARTTMITGIQSHIYGESRYAAEYKIKRSREKFLGSLMTQAGYQTQLIGKSHWHTNPSFRAGFEGWTRLRSINREIIKKRGYLGAQMHGIGGNEFTPALSDLPSELYTTNWLTDKCINFLEDREIEQPLFLWASYQCPHPPSVIHEPYYSMYDNENIPEPAQADWAEKDKGPYGFEMIRIGNAHEHMNKNTLKKARGVYYGMITNLDHQLGRLFSALRRNGLWENTIIIYTSDHGDMLGDYGTFFKSTFLEGAAHLPFIIRFPESMNMKRNTHSDSIIQLADLLPTFCDLADINPPDDITGKSLVPLFSHKKKKVRDDLHTQIGHQHMLFDGHYKYIYFAEDGRELLFDKSTDALDEHNLSDNKSLVEPMRKRFIEHLKQEKNKDLVKGKLLNLNKKIDPDYYTVPLDWMGL